MGNEINDLQLLSGYFLDAEYYEFDEDTETYKNPITFRFKQNDEGTQGVSAGSKKTELRQNTQGRYLTRYNNTIKVVASLPFKPQDNIKIINENRTYTIMKIFESYSTVNSLGYMQFPTRQYGRPKVLVLGE